MIVAQVSFAGQTRPVSCHNPLPDLEAGEACLVDLGGRTQVGRVLRVALDLGWEENAPLPKVLRRATPEDEKSESEQDQRRSLWLQTARQQAEDLGLIMRFLRCDPHPSGKKATFYFTAEGRVDFRQLVRDLARLLKARVEMRQIGVRDAAIHQGGVGHCGQPLCCSRWLPGFSPVSMKMAKAQGLPVNPLKISGQCGRLMCCLRYELDPETAGKAERGED